MKGERGQGKIRGISQIYPLEMRKNHYKKQEEKKMKRIVALIAVYVMIAANLFAADGDLIVNGKVGVGTTTPGTKLDVSGGIRAGDVTTCDAAQNGVIRWTGSSYEYCNGTAWTALGNGIAVRDTYRNLIIKNNAVNPNNQMDITADEVIASDGINPKLISSLSATVDITASGANGLDTGSEAALTWYHIWAIAKADGTKAGLLSTSAIAPTMPSGYTFKAYLGAVYNNSGSNFNSLRQINNKVAVGASTVLTNGAATSYTSISLSSVVPSTARKVSGIGWPSDPSSTWCGSYMATTSGGLGEIYIKGGWGFGGSSVNYTSYYEMIIVETQTIYYKKEQGTLTVTVSGWEY
ncbi:MAG: hypothetical protein HY957_06260 [Nitrospirae bacterium]|nr:hypothetical protein [Nitrospirota bacterium]